MDNNRYQSNVMERKEFFLENSKNSSENVFAEKVYIMIHTTYLKKNINIRTELESKWKAEFGIELSYATMGYLMYHTPFMTQYKWIKELYHGDEIQSKWKLNNTIIAMEFDLWLIERYNSQKELSLDLFSIYIKEKFGRYIIRIFENFKEYNLYLIETFDHIVEVLLPYYSDIKMIYEKLCDVNKGNIEYNNKEVDRVTEDELKETKELVKTEEDIQHKSVIKEAEMKEESVVTKEEKIDINTDFQLILNDKEEQIARLKNDIKEYKRQMEDIRKYSSDQFDKGIISLFEAMNDSRYGKIIDYFYFLLHYGEIDDTLKGYLDNLFLIFEDEMKIEPMISSENKLKVTEENLMKDFKLDFDKSEFDSSKVELKYAGWKYKNKIIEKPTIMLKER